VPDIVGVNIRLRRLRPIRGHWTTTPGSGAWSGRHFGPKSV